jgi:putative ABC transport system permease protein
VNVANLLLARATTRSTEVAVRGALGASRLRIVRQLLVESSLLAVLGGGLGVLTAKGGLAALLALAPDTLPRAATIAVDGRALGFALVLAALTGVGFGLVPALHTSRVPLGEALNRGGRRAGEGADRRRLRGALVVAEVAVALWLLAGAGLLMRSFTRLQEVNPGFDPRNVHVGTVFLPRPAYLKPAQHVAFAEQAMREIAALPGVQAVAAAANVPFSGIHLTDMTATTRSFVVPGRPPSTNADIPVSTWYTVTPQYFRAMSIPILRGRSFDARDVAGGSRVAMISESLARRFFPGQDPVGELINIEGSGPCEIVGIVADVKSHTLDGESTLQTYQPFAQSPDNDQVFVVRTAGPLGGMPEAIRRSIARVDASIPIYDARPLTSLVGASIVRQRFAMTLFMVFSAVALLLAAVGIYGVMAYSVGQRRGEIGIRMALGAHPADVVRLVFAQGARVIALGLLAGVIGALLLSRLLGALLFGVSGHDPATYLAVATVMIVVASAACLLPARRAASADPAAALRGD